MDVKPSNRAAPTSAKPTDAELARLIGEGDRKAAGVLVARYQASVRGFLLKISRNPDLADDIAQETFLRVLKYAKHYNPQYKMITWLLTIARRLWLNHLRRKDNQIKNTSYEQMSKSTPGPEQIVQQTDHLSHLRGMLDDAMTHLSEPQRTAIILFHQEQLPVSEIAQIMDMPQGTIKCHLHRARAAMRTILQPQMEILES